MEKESQIAEALLEVAAAIRSLGLNDAHTQMGAIELLSKEVRNVAEILNSAVDKM